jgi:hypothetical protein
MSAVQLRSSAKQNEWLSYVVTEFAFRLITPGKVEYGDYIFRMNKS